MRNTFLSLSLASAMFFTAAAPVTLHAESYRYSGYHSYQRHQHRKTAKRVGVGAVGGAVVGGLLGGGKGAAIGAAAGGGAGYAYDRHEKHIGR